MMVFQYPPSPHTRVRSLPSSTTYDSPPRRRYDCPPFPPTYSPRTLTQTASTSFSAARPTRVPALLLTPPSLSLVAKPEHSNAGRRTDDMPNSSPHNQAGLSSEAQVTGWKPTLPSIRPSHDSGAPGDLCQKPNPLAVRRRQSRFDPMGKDDGIDDESLPYGELGGRHPLRRVAEEDTSKEETGVSLPGIKALFGVAGGQAG